VMGTACVVAGGLVAAVTATAPSEHRSWLAAYLVLVAGVAQVALALGQAVLAPHPPSARTLAVEMAAWNLGNVAVMAGTLAGLTMLVDVGGALLVLSLAMLGAAVRGTGRPVGRAHHWSVLAFQILVVSLLASIAVGLWLARAHAG
ncbi:MAG: hypothetical protein ABI890_00445, partial [Lapillicoccus sp.]